MKNVNKLNIWKHEEPKKLKNEMFLNTNISELNLSVRSLNCLKRVNCHTIKDILCAMGEEGDGLRKIRNLGSRSEAEILQRVQEYKEVCAINENITTQKKVTIIKPAKKMWDREIEEFQLSEYALDSLKTCGIRRVGDLYVGELKQEPGWFAVKELFEKIPSCRS